MKFFDKDEIEWTTEYFNHNFYKTLLAIRKSCSALCSIDPSATTAVLTTSAPNNIFAYERKQAESELLVILNLTDSSRLKCTITGNFAGGRYASAFTGLEVDIDMLTTFDMLAWQYLVYIKV